MTRFLIVSSGRTGTVSIAESFRLHYPFMRSVHEPPGSRILRVLGNLYTSGNIDDRITSSVVHMIHAFGRIRNRREFLLESNPHACCLLPVYCRIYPDLVVVHVVRHPADFIRSYINHGAFNGIKGFLGHRIPYWFLRPEHMDDHDWPAWDKMTPMEASAWRWSILNHIIERDSRNSTSNYLRVRYEDLFHEGPGEWMRIADACGLDPGQWKSDTGLVHANASRLNETRKIGEWPEKLRSILKLRCAEQMRRYGYTIQ